MLTPGSGDRLTVRPACEADLDDIENMVSDFVRGHPAEQHTRSRSALREAYFGDVPVANLVVAAKHGAVVGMGQWTRIYDMFWSMYGGHVDWLYVRLEEAEESSPGLSPRFVRRSAAPVVSFSMAAETAMSSASTNA
jgi:hypothetical protein